MHRLPFVFIEREILVGSVAFGTSGARQHFGQLRHAGAVAAGIRAFGVDGAGDQFDEGFEQHLLRLDQFLVFQRNGG